jgi:hypothetical protein
VRAAVAIIAIEALALLGVSAWLVIEAIFGHPKTVAGALSTAGLSIAGAALLALGARGLFRLSPAARTPVLVLQLLAIPVSYSLAFQADRVAYGGPILVAAVAVIYLLFTPPARAALDRELR